MIDRSHDIKPHKGKEYKKKAREEIIDREIHSIYRNCFHTCAILGFVILLPVIISLGSVTEIPQSNSADVLYNFTFSFYDNGSLVHMNNTIYGLPDNDRDTLNDVWENAAANELSPRFSLDNNEEFFDHPEDKVVLFSRITPFPSQEKPRYIVFWYVVTWSRDYGKYGIGAHNGDTEPFIMIWKIIDNQTLALDSVYVHAHDGCNEHEDVWNATGISCNYASVCDFTLQKITMKQTCSSLGFFNNRLLLFVSKDKHALFPSGESCQSSILMEPSLNWNWTDPAGSMLNAAGSISNSFRQMSFKYYQFVQKTHFIPSVFNLTDSFSNIFKNFPMEISITEECNISKETPLRFPAFNTGEPDHLLITNLTAYGFSNEPITGKECGNGLRFSGGLACDGKGATPVHAWLQKFPEILKQRFLMNYN